MRLPENTISEIEFLTFMLSEAHSDEEFYAVDKKKMWQAQEEKRTKRSKPANA